MQVVTTTSNKYTTAFGFTEEEVFGGLDECGLGSEKEKVKEWYDGFIFGKLADIYNPWFLLKLFRCIVIFLPTCAYILFRIIMIRIIFEGGFYERAV